MRDPEAVHLAGDCFDHLRALTPDEPFGDAAIVPIRRWARPTAPSLPPSCERLSVVGEVSAADDFR